MSKINRRLLKYRNKLFKETVDFVGKLSESDYIKLLDNKDLSFPLVVGSRTIFIKSWEDIKRDERNNYTKILRETNYTRPKGHWTEIDVISFLNEVLQLKLHESNYNHDDLIQLKMEIADRYNLYIHQLDTYAKKYIDGCEKEDKFNIKQYFTKYELLRYKYADENKLYEDTENGKISDEDLELIKLIYKV